MLINIDNSSLFKQQSNQQTYVSSAIVAGGTSSPVKNIAGFNNQWAASLGNIGEETAEIMIISGTPAGTQLNFGTSPSHTAGTLLFGHNIDTPIYQIHYDQIVISRSTAGTAGPFSALATVSITPDSLYTQYNDSTGASTYAYYAQYYNSVSGDISGSSSIFTSSGPTFYSLQKIRSRIKGKLYSSGFIRDDPTINDWINEAYEELTNSAIKVNQTYMLGTATYAFGTTGIVTITDTTFKNVQKLEVTWDGQTYIPSTRIELRDFSEADFFNAFTPRHAWLGETTFEVLPHNSAGTAKVYYSQRFTPLINDSDEVTQTLKAYTRAFVEYGLAQAYGLDQKDQYNTHMEVFNQIKEAFVAEATPRDFSSAELISLGESISGLSDDIGYDVGDYVWLDLPSDYGHELVVNIKRKSCYHLLNGKGLHRLRF
ncbi:MAG: hypothetical protein KGI08_10105 [Thaumarchaeota archaeon]|nr:hypothetical protein [Nitrososphaerota archaeon]